MSFEHALWDGLPCPFLPEESWKRTSPESFLLPPEETLNMLGLPALEQANVFTPWKVVFCDWDAFVSSQGLNALEKQVGSLTVDMIKQEKERLVFLDVQEGIVRAFVSASLASSIEFISKPFDGSSVVGLSSFIGKALGEKLKRSSPHEVHISVKSQGQEVPLIVVNNGIDPQFQQFYAPLKYEVLENSQVDFLIIDGGAPHAHIRHTFDVKAGGQVSNAWLVLPNKDSSSENVKLIERKIVLHDKSRWNDMQLFRPNGLVRVTSHTLLNGVDAQSQSAGVVISHRGKFDYEPIQEHCRPRSQSKLRLKTILGGRARAIFQGLVRIEKEAPYVDAQQENKNLLLSSKARVDALPRLEILPHQVACKHGSATAEVDDKQLYYLMTRGFTESEAQKMITESFAMDLVAGFDEDHVCAKIMAEACVRASVD